MTTEPSDAETPAEVITATSTEAQLPSPAEGLSVLPPDHWTEVAQVSRVILLYVICTNIMHRMLKMMSTQPLVKMWRSPQRH